jgi:hypothetical protein
MYFLIRFERGGVGFRWYRKFTVFSGNSKSGGNLVGFDPPPGTNKTNSLSQFVPPERRSQNRLVAVLELFGSPGGATQECT